MGVSQNWRYHCGGPNKSIIVFWALYWVPLSLGNYPDIFKTAKFSPQSSNPPLEPSGRHLFIWSPIMKPSELWSKLLKAGGNIREYLGKSYRGY